MWGKKKEKQEKPKYVKINRGHVSTYLLSLTNEAKRSGDRTKEELLKHALWDINHLINLEGFDYDR